MIPLLELEEAQARLESLVPAHANYVGRASNYAAALLRESDLVTSVWLYPLSTERGSVQSLSGDGSIRERFAVLVLQRDINTTPDAGAALQAAVRLVRSAAIDLIDGWRPGQWGACVYTGGAQKAGGDRLYAWEDQYTTEIEYCE
ncbi:MAG: hypothetical protein GVY22_02275 [Gammaproteobacteria bacterium]|jgi:hypothetical protein|nr:hypothetical protein [Gammaproteobacteria bacterium]